MPEQEEEVIENEEVIEGGDEGEEKTPEEVLAEKEAEIERLSEELKGLQDKDLNFNKLRHAKLADLSEEEAAKLSEQEKSLMKRQEEIEARAEEIETREMTRYKDYALRSLGVDDEERRKKIEHNYSLITTEAKTEEEVKAKMKLAVNMLGETVAEPGITSSFQHQSYTPAKSSKRNFTETTAGKDLAKKLNLTQSKEAK